MNETQVKALIGDIFNEEELLDNEYRPSPEYESDSLERWSDFKKELKHSNRFFPTAGIDLDRLRDLLPHLLLHDEEVGSGWYRSRVQRGGKLHSVGEMGTPPKESTAHGRANPAGIPYLYLASGPSTAIAEVRPHTGDLVSVAEATLPGGLKIVDLGDPRRTVSPFVLVDEEEVGLLRADVGFLEQLGYELSRPVLPTAAAVDYTPTQYLCEFVKTCDYHGVRYKSAVGSDWNLALFEPGIAEIQSVRSHRVTQVLVRHDPL